MPNIATAYLYSDSLYSYKVEKKLNRFILSDSCYGSGHIYSNITDLKKLGNLFLANRLRIHDSLLYDKPSCARSKRGLIFQYTTLKNRKIYHHGGNSFGYDCLFAVDRNMNRIYIVLSNTESIASEKGNTNFNNIFIKLVTSY